MSWSPASAAFEKLTRPSKIVTAPPPRTVNSSPSLTSSAVFTVLGRLANNVEAGAMLVFYYEHHAEVHATLLELGAVPVDSLATVSRPGRTTPVRLGRPVAGG